LLCYWNYLIFQIWDVMLLRSSHWSKMTKFNWVVMLLSHLSNLSCYVIEIISFIKFELLCYWKYLIFQIWDVMLLRLSHWWKMTKFKGYPWTHLFKGIMITLILDILIYLSWKFLFIQWSEYINIRIYSLINSNIQI